MRESKVPSWLFNESVSALVWEKPWLIVAVSLEISSLKVRSKVFVADGWSRLSWTVAVNGDEDLIFLQHLYTLSVSVRLRSAHHLWNLPRQELQETDVGPTPLLQPWHVPSAMPCYGVNRLGCDKKHLLTWSTGSHRKFYIYSSLKRFEYSRIAIVKIKTQR